jgi:hypothetical protein
MVFGANTYRAYAQMLATSTQDSDDGRTQELLYRPTRHI